MNKKDKFAIKYHRVVNYEESEAIDDKVCFLLYPVDKEDVKLLTFNEEGKAIPSDPDSNNWDHQRAKYTIDVLRLYHEDLEQERKRVWGEMTDLIDEIHNALTVYNNLSTQTNRNNLEQYKEKVRYRIAPCSEFTSLYRACLRASYEDWALQLLEERLDLDKYCKSYLSQQ